MKAWIGIILLGTTACTEEAVFIDWADEPWTLEWTEYARVQDIGKAHILKNGPPLRSEPTPNMYVPDPAPVIELGPSMRILVEREGITFLAYVDDDNTYDVVPETLRGSANPSHTGDAGVWFLAGTQVNHVFTDDTSEHVEYRGGGLELESWFPPETIQPFFEKDTVPLTPTEGEFILLVDGARLLDAPHGAAFGSIDLETTSPLQIGIMNENDEGLIASSIGTEKQGHQLIEIHEEEGEIQVRAYVKMEDTFSLQSGQGLGFYGTGYGGSCGCSMGFQPNVLQGTPVYDDLDGEVVGWVTQDQHFQVDEVDSDWARIQISWLFDTGEVWIRTIDILPPPKPRFPLLNGIHLERNPPQTTAPWNGEELGAFNALDGVNNGGLGGLISAEYP